MYSGITSGRVLNGELLYTKILEVNLFAFAYRLFHEDFSSIIGDFCIHTYTEVLEVNLFAFAYRLFRRDFFPLDGTFCMILQNAKCPVEWGEISTKQSVGKCKQINF